MEIWLLQGIYLLITLVVTLSFGLLPYKSKFLKRFTFFISLLNAFSGGMFLSMGMVHILPEAVASYKKGRKVYEKKEEKKEHVHSESCSHGV